MKGRHAIESWKIENPAHGYIQISYYTISYNSQAKSNVIEKRKLCRPGNQRHIPKGQTCLHPAVRKFQSQQEVWETVRNT